MKLIWQLISLNLIHLLVKTKLWRKATGESDDIGDLSFSICVPLACLVKLKG